MADQLVEEFGTDQRMGGSHGLAQKVVLHCAQHIADLGLDIGSGRAEHEVDRDLLEAELGEVVVECGARTVFHDTAQGVHLHIFACLGVLAAHQCQLAVHHLNQRIGGV